MDYKINTHYPITELDNISEWWKTNRMYDINEYDDHIEIVERDRSFVKDDKISELKSELEKIKEDIEQEIFGLVRDDYDKKKARAAEIVNELRVLEGKDPREIRT